MESPVLQFCLSVWKIGQKAMMMEYDLLDINLLLALCRLNNFNQSSHQHASLTPPTIHMPHPHDVTQQQFSPTPNNTYNHTTTVTQVNSFSLSLFYF